MSGLSFWNVLSVMNVILIFFYGHGYDDHGYDGHDYDGHDYVNGHDYVSVHYHFNYLHDFDYHCPRINYFNLYYYHKEIHFHFNIH